jgi:thiosulfate sulfurtransferase
MYCSVARLPRVGLFVCERFRIGVADRVKCRDTVFASVQTLLPGTARHPGGHCTAHSHCRIVAMSNFKTISATDAKTMLDTRPTQLIDIRDEQTFALAHMPGAQRIDNDNIQAFIAAADRSQPLIVVCYHGISSQNAAQFMAAQGFAEVYSLTGGFEDWQRTYPSGVR